MSLYQLIAILRARKAVILTLMLATLALALGWVLLRPHNYTARTPVLVDVRTDPTNATPWQGMVAPSFMTTQIDIIKSDRVAQRVAQILPPDQAPLKGLREEAAGKPAAEHWIAQVLQQRLEVKPARESNIINIAWTGRSPAEAARVADAFAQAYLETNLDIKTEPAKKYTVWFDEQLKAARDRLQQAQQKLGDYQQKAGIVDTDERRDFETTRLTELNQQLMIATTRGRGGAPASTSSPLVDNLRQDVARLEAKIGDASATMGPNHPQMQRLQGELSSLKRRLSEESARVGVSAASSAEAQKARIRELETAVADQKQRVLSMNKDRAQLNLLKSEVDTAQKAFETVSASAAQARMQAMSNQTNVMKLASAVEPSDPIGPTALQAMLVALVAGTILGIATALLLELTRRRVRTSADLSMAAGMPVLATVPAANAARYRDGPLRLAQSPRRLALASQGSAA
ncbi:MULTISPECIES: Wzz/FepE/Etk N-terminal domain-containing protein [Ramlibacter]|uniref:Chain length determinant protein EpsF n=1 Tax=Ramlibacter aquaticus TaxID=2780094 RepID=A0ABR9SIX0_9BURK|nr:MULTISPECIES: Wzz/FepE/Etk N-terminal domain-containing protein [Ramlibacter]MBE7941702.1 chain length determinant protein EpsF [Ramlibacter aquaticus]